MAMESGAACCAARECHPQPMTSLANPQIEPGGGAALASRLDHRDRAASSSSEWRRRLPSTRRSVSHTHAARSIRHTLNQPLLGHSNAQTALAQPRCMPSSTPPDLDCHVPIRHHLPRPPSPSWHHHLTLPRSSGTITLHTSTFILYNSHHIVLPMQRFNLVRLRCSMPGQL